MKLFSRLFLVASLVYAIGVCTFIAGNQNIVNAAMDASNIVISQIQIEGTGSGNAGQEFVELYNPTNSAINLTKWNLTRESSSSATKQTLISSMSGTINARSYFLIGSPSFPTTPVAPDLIYSATNSAITDNNTIILYNGDPNVQNSTATIVDKVGMGLAVDNEANDALNPNAGQSIIRKATANSTAQTVAPGGAESTFGNGYDTDNNGADFVLLSTALPKNSKSPQAIFTPTPIPTSTPIPTAKPTDTPIPTNIPTPTATNTPIPTQTPIPTNTPTPTATPTPTPTLKPTATPTPTIAPTAAPTATPTGIPTSIPQPTVIPTQIPTHMPTITIPQPTITPKPSNTPIPTIIITPTPTPPSHIIINDPISRKKRLVCTQTIRWIRILRIHFPIPIIHCSIISK